MSFRKIAKLTSINEGELKLSVGVLAKKYKDEKRGLRILIKGDKAQMVTAGENNEFVEKFLKADIEGGLSRAASEAVSIIAYRGPLARSEVEEIRGVNCSFTLRHLMIRGLIERINNPEDARAYLYKISFDFLKKLGIESVEELPRYDELNKKELLVREENKNKE